MPKDIIIAVDFDGTIVDHRFPDIGSPVPGAISALKELSDAGAKLILWTMRSGQTLADAVEYLKENGVDLFGVNENPGQTSWTQSPKAYAHVYVDDAAFGCPLHENPRSGGRPYVDWDAVTPSLLKMLGK